MGQRNPTVIKRFLEEKVHFYNNPSFIETDPVSIPRLFSRKEDIEIAGFLTATIAWGNRRTILKNARVLVQLMDDSPFEFVTSFTAKDLKRFEHYVHRTFNGIDCIFFLKALKNIYLRYGGLEKSFLPGLKSSDRDLGNAISEFRQLFFEIPHADRTKKHLSNPAAGSAAKRMNMFLRWMVRNDNCGVDFGLWKSISPSLLLCPLDVHSGRVARKLGLLEREQNDWKAVQELTFQLRLMDPADPAKFDFALFGLGVFEKF